MSSSGIASFLKKNGILSTALLASGFGLGYLVQKQLSKDQKEKVQEIAFEEFKAHKGYGDLKPEHEVSKEELVKLMEEYIKLLSEKKILERVIPRQFASEDDLRALTDNLQYTKDKNDLESLTKAISEPVWDLLDRGGKRWRPILCMFIMEAYGTSFEEFPEIVALCEIVHNGTLIIDDIEDNSKTRRNKPCVHLLFGTDIAVNAGCMMYYAPFLAMLKALEKNKKIPKERLINFSKIYAEEMVNIHFGQGWDIFWHNRDKTDKIPTVEEYLQMTSHKTGVLARMSARLACEAIGLPSEIQKRMADFSEKIGVAFQIQDDILNLVGEEYVATKGMYGEDIHEGKMSLMVNHSLTHGTPEDNERLKEILKMKTEDQALIKEAIDLIKKTNSIEFARLKAEQLIQEAWDGIKDYIPNNKFKGCLKCLAEFFIDRKK